MMIRFIVLVAMACMAWGALPPGMHLATYEVRIDTLWHPYEIMGTTRARDSLDSIWQEKVKK